MAQKKTLIIDESTADRDLFVRGRRTGLDLSSRPEGFAYGGTAEPFPDQMVISRADWQAMIQEMEERKSRLGDLVKLAGLPCKDQAQTNYCWVNAPTYTMEVTRVKQNQTMEILSAASVGGPITGFKNVGGWGKSALEWISTKGIVPVNRWPVNAIDKRLYTEENKALAASYRCPEWWELEPGNLDHLISCLLLRIPVAIGLSWWSHEVTAEEAVWVDGAIAIKCRNSWGMSYGTNGYFVLQGRRMLPDDAVAPRTAIAA